MENMNITQKIEQLGKNIELAAVFAEHVNSLAGDLAFRDDVSKELAAMTAALADILHLRSIEVEVIEKELIQQ